MVFFCLIPIILLLTIISPIKSESSSLLEISQKQKAYQDNLQKFLDLCFDDQKCVTLVFQAFASGTAGNVLAKSQYQTQESQQIIPQIEDLGKRLNALLHWDTVKKEQFDQFISKYNQFISDNQDVLQGIKAQDNYPENNYLLSTISSSLFDPETTITINTKDVKSQIKEIRNVAGRMYPLLIISMYDSEFRNKVKEPSEMLFNLNQKISQLNKDSKKPFLKVSSGLQKSITGSSFRETVVGIKADLTACYQEFQEVLNKVTQESSQVSQFDQSSESKQEISHSSCEGYRAYDCWFNILADFFRSFKKKNLALTESKREIIQRGANNMLHLLKLRNKEQTTKQLVITWVASLENISWQKNSLETQNIITSELRILNQAMENCPSSYRLCRIFTYYTFLKNLQESLEDGGVEEAKIYLESKILHFERFVDEIKNQLTSIISDYEILK
jgi:hypothetical protein